MKRTQAEIRQAYAEQCGGYRLKVAGGELNGPCPNCGGRDRFWIRRDGVIGCRKCEDFKAIMTVLFPNERFEGEKIEEPSWDTARRHVYPSGDVKLVRAKGPWQRAAWNRPGGTRQHPPELYRRQGIEAGEIVVLVEGEKDVDSLHDLGVLAVSGQNGAGEKKVGAYLDELEKVSRVTLIPDLDDAGKNWTLTWTEALTQAGIAWRIVDLDRVSGEQGTGFDVSDLILVKGIESKVELATVMRDGLLRAGQLPGPEPIIVPTYDPNYHSGFVWNPYVVSGRLNILAGQEGDGKSLITLSLAAALANGCGEFWSKPCCSGSTLYIGAEDEQNEIAGRYLAAGGVEGGLHLLASPDDLVLDEDGARWIALEANRIPNLKLIVIDPFQEYLPSDLDLIDQRATGRYLAKFNAQISEIGATLLGIFHYGRRQDVGRALDKIYFGANFTKKARSALSVFPDPDVPMTERNRSYVLAHSKMNSGQKGKSLRYRIDSWATDKRIPRVGFVDESLYTADELVHMMSDADPRRVKRAVDAIEAWILDAQGFVWKVRDLKKAITSYGGDVRVLTDALLVLEGESWFENGELMARISDKQRVRIMKPRLELVPAVVDGGMPV